MLANLAHEVYTQLDAEWQWAARWYVLPCGPGCADCCKASNSETPFISLPMSRPEADLLWQALIALPLPTRALLIDRERRNYSAACMLLSPGDLCLIYEARPLWCRIFGLPGVMGCAHIPAVQDDIGVKQSQEAVNEAWRKLRSADSNLVPLRELIRGLAYVK